MHSYIVMVSPSYGGAEKRFFDILTALKRRGVEIYFIAPHSLIEKLKKDHDNRSDVFGALIPLYMESWSRIQFIRKFNKLLKTLPRGSSFHYPLNCLWPLHIGRSDEILMSVVDCTSVPGPFSGRRTTVWAWISLYFVAKIDVLSPTIFFAMKAYRAAPCMSLTPGGTFMIPTAPNESRKLPIVVFMSRLVPLKGLEHFLDILPEVWGKLRNCAPEGLLFKIAGYGPLEENIAKRVVELANSGLPVSFVGYASSDSLLNQAAVVLSLQEITNYPSRVVAEALLASCGVIVRDTGDSREFGEHVPGLLYCDAKLDGNQLAHQISTLMASVICDEGFSQKLREAAITRFSSTSYVDYFYELICTKAKLIQLEN